MNSINEVSQQSQVLRDESVEIFSHISSLSNQTTNPLSTNQGVQSGSAQPAVSLESNTADSEAVNTNALDSKCFLSVQKMFLFYIVSICLILHCGQITYYE